MKTIVLAGLSSWFFGVSTAGYADFMDLDQAVAYALEHNPQLAAATQQTQASNAAEQAVGGQRLPSVDLSYSTRRSNNPLDAFADKLNTGSVNPATDFSPEALNDPAPSTLHATQLSVSLPVYTGGRIDASIRAAEANTHSAKFSQERLGRFTVFQVRKNYREAQASTERLVIATAAAEAANNHVTTTSRLVRQGRIITSDKLTAEVNLAAVNAALEQARTRSRLAFNQLATLLGRAPTDPGLSLTPWPQTRPAIALPPLSQLEQQALTQRKDLLALSSLQQASHAEIDQARANYKPQFLVVGNNQWFDSPDTRDDNSWSVMGVVKMNLFSGGSHRNQIAAKTYQSLEVEQRIRAARLQVINEVRNAHALLQEAKARLQLAADNVTKAERTVELVTTRYGQGRTILIDLLQAERALVDARNEALNAALAHDTGIDALELAVGVKLNNASGT